MKETILLYNLDSAAIRNKIKFLCIQGGIHIRVVEKNQYDVPIGTLAFGKKENQLRDFAKAYLVYKLVFLAAALIILGILVYIGLDLADKLLAYMEML